MKKEDLLKAMSEIDSDLIKSSEYKKNRKGWIKWAAAAAGLALILFVAGNVDIHQNQGTGQNAEGKQSQQEIKNGSGEEGQVGAAYLENKQNKNSDTVDEIKPEKEVDYVDIDGIVAKAQNISGVYNESLAITMLEQDDFTYVYERIEGISSDTLRECLGTQLDDSNWYYLEGHSEMQYLIARKGDQCELWKFAYCQNEDYPYGDILKKMYGIYSYADIAKIIVEPSNINNTDEGKKLQEQIGSKEITDESRIQAFYEMLSSRTCYGDNNWGMIELGDDTDSGMEKAVTQVRYLTIKTTKGETLEIKYTAISDMFYQYMGVAYEPLSQEQAHTLENMLGIQ